MVDRSQCESGLSNWPEETPDEFDGIEPLDSVSTMTEPPGSPSFESELSSWSAEQQTGFKGTASLDSNRNVRPGSPSCKSGVSDMSLDPPLHFGGRNLLQNSSVASGTGSTADSGVSMSKSDWSREELQELRPSPRSAEAGDVSCDLCEGMKLKAYKSCMTCLASFCETHVRDHYSIPALQRHLLVEVTKNLSILQENAQLKKTIKKVEKENLTLRMENSTLRFPEYIWKGKTPVAANVVLDPATAHRSLVLSADGKRVQLGEKKFVDDSTQRFDKYECALAKEGFSSGWHYWEVEVNREFTIGVTRESAQRRGRFIFSPNVGYWCLYHYRQSFTALEEPSKRLPIDAVPRVLGVCIDMNEKWVTFYNTETKTHIYTFKHMDFPDGEKIYPVFGTLEKSADLSIKNNNSFYLRVSSKKSRVALQVNNNCQTEHALSNTFF